MADLIDRATELAEEFDTQKDVEQNPCGAWMAIQELHQAIAALPAQGVGVKPDRDTFDAMCAMRDSINEYIPMPSLESDLLQGPENSVFCATVAEAVIAEVRRLRASKVRQLEWHNFDAWTHWAEGACGTYHVEERNGYWQVELRVGGLVHGVTATDDTTPEYLDAAKAAAQADYERRILAALAPTDAAQAVADYVARQKAMTPEDRAEIDAAVAELAPAAQAREAALSVLSGLSSYLGAGLGDDATTPEQYDDRIRWGIDHQIAVTVQRCANVIEELSKEAYSGKRVPWGQIKQAVLAVFSTSATMPAAHVNETPKREHDAGNMLTAAQAREAALAKKVAEICDGLAIGYAAHKGAGMALADAKREILALIEETRT